MATGTNPNVPDAWRRCAHDQLDLPPDATADAARRMLLAKLEKFDFMPPPGWDGALRAAGFAPCDGDTDTAVFASVRRALEEALRLKVEQFASDFFTLPVDARKIRFRGLWTECQGMPAVAARLQELQAGLDLQFQMPAGTSSEISELLIQAQRLFLLPRHERASERATFLEECRNDPAPWQHAASVAMALPKYARAAALEPTLFKELCTLPEREKLSLKLARRRQRAYRRMRPPTVLLRRSPRLPGSVWLLIVLVVLGGIANLTEERKPKQAPTAPVPTLPHVDLEKMNRELDRIKNRPPIVTPNPLAPLDDGNDEHRIEEKWILRREIEPAYKRAVRP